eukprot:TRINITY_DN6221_c0_g1_i2.p1 TRINITY_DN6221_c0_g1~~TRINITY_DN6221_c0_g1_i2.p1  ORF type:complete len:313 (+),score=93.44 TRINITY_DN6221_c0_g1_i2:173-1111(+)
MSDMIYFESQVAGLCAVHCLNSLLQGAYFTEIDLMQVGQEFDRKEKLLMAEAGMETPEFLKYMAEDSGNVADDGNYSIQVLAEALKVWNLSCILYTSQEAKSIRENPLNETAFICNQGNHWLTIRKIGDGWYNLNSLLKSGPQFLSNFYLSAYLDSLLAQQYSIFVVRGDLPPSHFSQLSSNGEGKWYPVHSISKKGKDVVYEIDEDEKEEQEMALAVAASLANDFKPKDQGSQSQPICVDDDEVALAMAIELSKQTNQNQTSTSTPPTTNNTNTNTNTTTTTTNSNNNNTTPTAQQKQKKCNKYNCRGIGS